MEKSHVVTDLKLVKSSQNPKTIETTASRRSTDIQPQDVVERIKDNPILANIVLVSLRSEPVPNSAIIGEYEKRLGPEFMSSYGFFKQVMDLPSYPDIPLDEEIVEQALEDPVPAEVLSQIGKTATVGERIENMNEIRRHVYRANELLFLSRHLILEIADQKMEGYEIEQAS